MNELSTMLYRINFRYILDHFLDQALWKKSWRIYEYDGCQIDMRLYSINIDENKLILSVRRARHWQNNTFSLPLAKEHFNEEVFYRQLFTNLISTIRQSENTEIYESEPYKAARYQEVLNRELNKAKAEKKLDELGIDDEDVRKAYIESYTEDNQVYLASQVIESLRYILHSARYLMLAYQFENILPEQSKALITEVRAKCLDEGIDHQTKQITQALTLFNFEEMTNLKDALEHLKEKQQEEEDAAG